MGRFGKTLAIKINALLRIWEMALRDRREPTFREGIPLINETGLGGEGEKEKLVLRVASGFRFPSDSVKAEHLRLLSKYCVFSPSIPVFRIPVNP